jgi:dihydrofolate synthase/folylpolyglutamate synthase
VPGLYTSPHLVRVNERIRLGDQEITDAALERHLRLLRSEIEAALRHGHLDAHPSFFEVMTAAALLAFRDEPVGLAVLEVGLGGRLDATNAVDADCAVIVSVDLDHTKSLGPTVERIAEEKAGVIKPGRAVVSGVSHQQAAAVVLRESARRGARLVDARVAVRLVAEEGGRITLETVRARYTDLRLALVGRHQIDNARVAVAALEELSARLGLTVTPEAVRRGLGSVRWPGRLQWVREPWGTGPDLLLDGAHNPGGLRVLAAYLDSLHGPAPVAVFGAMQGKLVRPMLERLAPLVGDLVLTRPDVDRALDPAEIAALARDLGPRIVIESTPSAALERARRLAGADRFVLVTGSLYLVGNVMGLLEGRSTPGAVPL